MLILSYPSNPTAQWVDLDFYREAVKHRQAAVADSRLLRLKPGTPGDAFGEGE